MPGPSRFARQPAGPCTASAHMRSFGGRSRCRQAVAKALSVCCERSGGRSSCREVLFIALCVHSILARHHQLIKVLLRISQRAKGLVNFSRRKRCRNWRELSTTEAAGGRPTSQARAWQTQGMGSSNVKACAFGTFIQTCSTSPGSAPRRPCGHSGLSGTTWSAAAA